MEMLSSTVYFNGIIKIADDLTIYTDVRFYIFYENKNKDINV